MTFVVVAYLATILAIGGYAVSLVARRRAVERALATRERGGGSASSGGAALPRSDHEDLTGEAAGAAPTAGTNADGG